MVLHNLDSERKLIVHMIASCLTIRPSLMKKASCDTYKQEPLGHYVPPQHGEHCFMYQIFLYSCLHAVSFEHLSRRTKRCFNHFLVYPDVKVKLRWEGPLLTLPLLMYQSIPSLTILPLGDSQGFARSHCP